MCITNRTMFKKEIENYLRSHKGCLAWRLPLAYNLVVGAESKFLFTSLSQKLGFRHAFNVCFDSKQISG